MAAHHSDPDWSAACSESDEQFIHRHNVINYMRRLAAARDEAQRLQLIALLAEERGKARQNGWPPVIG